MTHLKIKDIMLVLLVTLIWGSAYVIIHLGLAEFPPVLNASLRFVCASLPFIFFVKRNNTPWKWIIIIGITFICMFSFMYTGMKIGMAGGLTSLVMQTQVLFTVILAAIMLRDHPTIWQKIGIFLGFGGIALIASEMADFTSLTSLFFLIVASFFYGLISIWLKMAGKVNMLSLIVWVSLIPPVPLFLLSLITEHGQLDALVHMSIIGLSSILYTGIFGTVISFALWGRLLKSYSSHVVAPFALLIPVFGMALSSVVIGESFSLLKLYASGLILVGLLFIISGKRIFDTVKLFFSKQPELIN